MSTRSRTAASVILVVALAAIAGAAARTPMTDAAAETATATVTGAPAPTAEPMPSLLPEAAPSEPAGPDPDPPPVPDLGAVPNLDVRAPMPLDPYKASMTDIRTLDLARDTAAADCMRSRGFSTWTAGIVRSWEPEDYIEADILEHIDPTDVARNGYPRPEAPPAAMALSSSDEDQRAPTEEEMRAYDGVPAQTLSGRAVPEDKGCYAEGKEALYGTHSPELEADPRALSDDASFLAMRHPAVTNALFAWWKCVAQQGLSYEDPMSARYDIRWAARDAATPASEEEKRVARIDALCQREFNVVQWYRTAKAAYERTLLGERAADVAASQETFATWLAEARTILAAR